ncbi:MAG: septum formation initiator family protein [Cellulomonadaceae bacterium]|nr:septum formation initiator family protein [Cellulomonadaceae bacterium]
MPAQKKTSASSSKKKTASALPATPQTNQRKNTQRTTTPSKASQRAAATTRAAVSKGMAPVKRHTAAARASLAAKPEVFTMRLLVLALIGLIALVLVVPTVRGRIEQAVEIHELRSDVKAQQAYVSELQSELERWDDPAFVEGQARERLGFKRPGDTAWRLVGGEALLDDVDPETGLPVEPGIVGVDDGEDRTWFELLWESVRVADGPPAGEEQDDHQDISGLDDSIQ